MRILGLAELKGLVPAGRVTAANRRKDRRAIATRRAYLPMDLPDGRPAMCADGLTSFKFGKFPGACSVRRADAADNHPDAQNPPATLSDIKVNAAREPRSRQISERSMP